MAKSSSASRENPEVVADFGCVFYQPYALDSVEGSIPQVP
jgi:hypothetical protein